MSSRNIADLVESARTRCKEWISACAVRSVTVLVYCTWRSAAEQDVLYAQGRTTSGPVVTWARGWESWHQLRRAWDAVPMLYGKPLWGFSAKIEQWLVCIDEARKLGIEWAGNWPAKKREEVHWQVTDGLDYEDARKLVETLGLPI